MNTPQFLRFENASFALDFKTQLKKNFRNGNKQNVYNDQT